MAPGQVRLKVTIDRARLSDDVQEAEAKVGEARGNYGDPKTRLEPKNAAQKCYDSTHLISRIRAPALRRLEGGP